MKRLEVDADGNRMIISTNIHDVGSTDDSIRIEIPDYDHAEGAYLSPRTAMILAHALLAMAKAE